MAFDAAPEPFVIRSERNKERREAHSTSTDASFHVGVEKTERDLSYGTQSRLKLVNPKDYLGYFSTSALIINKTIGTGIFVAPATVLAITESKGLSIILWLIGGGITWAGLVVYLEYGIRWPLTGGELHYIDIIWRKPKLLMTYMYSIMFILLQGGQANALVFGQSVLQASTPVGTPLENRLQKFFAILLVGVVCLLQGLSRINYVRFSNLFAWYKITFLSTLTVIGWCALSNRRTSEAAASDQPYGPTNLSNSFRGSTNQPYAIALALLDIFRVYSGYENANFVLEEVRRPPNDPNMVFRRAAKFAILLVCFFYMMFNVALFTACTTEELISSSDVLSLFFEKVFGASPKTRVASGVLLCMSSAGNVMSATFSAVRVKQEIARMGILPFPAFWAKTTRLNTPGPALLLHWIFTTVIIAATPLNNDNGYLVFSTLINYARTVVSIIIGIGILGATREDSPWARNGERWRPQGSRSAFGRWCVFPLAVLSISANIFVFALIWVPESVQKTLHTKAAVLPSFVGPLVTICCFIAGALYWLWDERLGPRLGYRTEVLQETQEGLNVVMSFERHISGFARRTVERYMMIRDFVRNPLGRPLLSPSANGGEREEENYNNKEEELVVRSERRK